MTTHTFTNTDRCVLCGKDILRAEEPCTPEPLGEGFEIPSTAGRKMLEGLTQALQFAHGEHAGSSITVSTYQEHIIGGIRFAPGRYQIKCIENWGNNDAGF